MMGLDSQAQKARRDTNIRDQKAGRGAENQNLGAGHRQEERKMDGGCVIDINRRRRGDSEGEMWENIYSPCVESGQKTRGKRQRDETQRVSGWNKMKIEEEKEAGRQGKDRKECRRCREGGV